LKKRVGVTFRHTAYIHAATYRVTSPETMLRFGQIMETLYRQKNGVHAFGYNSVESEQI